MSPEIPSELFQALRKSSWEPCLRGLPLFQQRKLTPEDQESVLGLGLIMLDKKKIQKYKIHKLLVVRVPSGCNSIIRVDQLEEPPKIAWIRRYDDVCLDIGISSRQQGIRKSTLEFPEERNLIAIMVDTDFSSGHSCEVNYTAKLSPLYSETPRKKPERKKPTILSDYLEVENISAYNLYDFLRGQEVDFEKYPYAQSEYFGIFDCLRTLPLSQQEEHLVNFFAKYVKDFPQGEKLARLICKFNNIEWLEPCQNPDPEKLQMISDQFYQRLNRKPLPLRIVDGLSSLNDLVKNQSRETVIDPTENFFYHRSNYVAEHVAKREGREVACKKADDLSDGTTWGAAIRRLGGELSLSRVAFRIAVWDVTRCAQWITVEDKMPDYGYDKGNPRELLFDGIYDQGFLFIGPYQGESIVVVPSIKFR